MSCTSINSRLFLLCLLLTSGCAAPQIRQPAHMAAPEVFQLQGRIGVRYGAEGFSGNIHWRHGTQVDEILLLSPLGQVVARIERNTTGVRLDTPDEHHEAQDAAELTGRVLGWRLPLAGLQYWVTGHAAPDDAASMMRDESMNISQLSQQEWEIGYRDYRQVGHHVLPTRIVMRNASLELRLVVDEWELP
jgi:outer membrane lipoprotein LolB